MPKFSYINNYNAIPAHDWLAPSEAAFEEPASMIILAERRATMNDAAKTKIGQWKGTSAFIWTSGVSVGSGQICPSDAFRFATPADAAAGLLGKKDKPEIVRVKFDRHTVGANYTFADGHAKWHRFEQTLDPINFLWGKTWYSAPFQNTPLARPCP